MIFRNANAIGTSRIPLRFRAVTPRRRVPAIFAFTLMEVMIAIAVFCIGVFAILGLVASVMRGARLLNKPMVDAGAVAGVIANTNSLVEIQGASGDLSEFLGDNYKGYDYVYGITEIESNHLYQAEILVTGDTPGKPVLSKMDVLLFRPQSPPGSLDFGSMQR
ncbi:MAG TPA: prepilin-type N-terminal cleavage/methylation domain-containing protein [Verrucomicrobiae bacterium]|nr:prepilin-type N-terminal cleavage/methylation domain-containing protein [Verrucomicrobiae bacterium]